MEARTPALPKLDALRHQAVTAPVLGPLRRLAAGRRRRRVIRLHLRAAGDGLALPRRDGRQPALQRTAVEILVAVLGRRLLDRALDAHLPLHLAPEKQQGGVRVGAQLLAFL